MKFPTPETLCIGYFLNAIPYLCLTTTLTLQIKYQGQAEHDTICLKAIRDVFFPNM